MTLLTETTSNQIVAKYDGDKLDIYAMNDDGDNKKLFFTQLSSDDIKDLITKRSNKNSLEDRLKTDYKCNYNFKRPTVRQHRGYAKKLLESLKAADLVMPSPVIKTAITRRRKKSRLPKKTRSQGKPHSKKRKKSKRKIKRKTIKYTPYPISSLADDDDTDVYQKGNTSLKTIPINELSDRMPITIRKLITDESKKNSHTNPILI